ncbi:MAG: hypothetical protein DI570_24265 [Phenylobacterium zucineum]|nr:MAG: hypothetical protein DI570_24265 [Phenylobacterium zucineum]
MTGGSVIRQAELGRLLARVPEALYHRGLVDGEESLSHSGMKTLLGRTPAHFRREVDHPEDRAQKKAFDLGSAAHAYILGSDAGIAEIRRGAPTDEHPFGTGEPYDDFRTKDAQTKRDEAYALDLIPILAKDVARVEAMVAALHEHPTALDLLTDGTPEVSAFARDPETKVILRARFDWLRRDNLLVDYKTGVTADPAAFSRRALDYGYYLQDPTYRHVLRLCGVEPAGFEFVLQETTPPYAVAVVHLEPATRQLGELRMRQAIALFAECQTAGVWPGYPAESVGVDVPWWALRDLDDAARAAATGEDGEEPDHSGIFEFLDSINH